jgi:transcriptional regulator with GAF, ATPase, and Fis domain
MATAARSRNEASLGWDELQALVLRIWEVVNRERGIDGLLAAIAGVLQHRILFAAASLISIGPEGTRVLGTYAQRNPQSLSGAGTSIAYLQAELDIGVVAFDFSYLTRMMAPGKPFTCADLQLKQTWQDYELALARMGTRAYALQPLILGREIIGSAIFSRTKPEPFTSEQLRIMRAVSPAIASALGNALENKKDAEKIETLEAENRNLREQISWFNDRAPEHGTGTAACIEDELLYLRDRMLDAEPSAQNLDGNTVRSSGSSIDAQLQHQERRLIETTLTATHGRVSGPKGAALLLGLPSSTLEFRIQRLAIDKFQFRQKPPKREGR